MQDKSLRDLRLQFAKEDAVEARGGTLLADRMTEKQFLSLGLDLETKQLVV